MVGLIVGSLGLQEVCLPLLRLLVNENSEVVRPSSSCCLEWSCCVDEDALVGSCRRSVRVLLAFDRPLGGLVDATMVAFSRHLGGEVGQVGVLDAHAVHHAQAGMQQHLMPVQPDKLSLEEEFSRGVEDTAWGGDGCSIGGWWW